MGAIALAAVALVLIALVALVVVAMRGATKPRFFAHAEYWVYMPGEQLPPQDAIMHRMLRQNPHRPGGRNPITPAEALLFSDVRLHIAQVLRSRNPHVFRPDLFEEHVDPTPDTLRALGEAQSFSKVRFISEDPLSDRRHLQFLPHAAGAIAELGRGSAVYDVITERLMTAEELFEALDRHEDLTIPDLHTRVVWRRTPHGGAAETRGLVKIGFPEISTEEMDSDQRVLVKALLDEAIRALWNEPALPKNLELSYFEDRYRIELQPQRKGPARALLMKLPAGAPAQV